MKRNLNPLFAPLFFFSLLLAVTGFAQGQQKEMSDSIGLHSYTVFRGDTLLINYDTAYLLNRKTFALYRNTYKQVQAGSLSNQKILVAYDTLVALQDKMLKQKEADYQGLKKNFDSLAMASNTFLARTDVNVTAINQSLDRATDNLTNIKALLDDSLEKLKKESRQRLKIAVKGFAVGVGTASLAFLLLK